MALKRRTFGTSLAGTNLGIFSRKGSTVTAKIPQIDWENKAIDKEAVSTQSFVLESDGKNRLKIRGAFHRDSPLCAYMDNTPTDETSERRMPLPLVAISTFDSIEDIPKELRDNIKKGKVSNFNFVAKDADGNIEAEARKDGDTWYKVEYNVPLYKQYYTETFGEITDEKADGSDEEGNFILTHSKFCYVSLANLGLFNGHEVDEAGNKVNDTEGTYMVEGEIGEKYFSRVSPLRSGARVSIGNRLNKVMAHPTYGIVEQDDIAKSGYLKRGKFTYSNEAVTVAIYNNEGEIAAILSDRRAYKINDFVAKKSLKAANTVAEASNAIADDIAKTEAAGAEAVSDVNIEDLM